MICTQCQKDEGVDYTFDNRTICSNCFLENKSKTAQKLLSYPKVIFDPFSGEYFPSFEDLYEYYYDITEVEKLPAYVFSAKKVNLSLDIIDIVKDAIYDLSPDIDLNFIPKTEYSNLENFIKKWCKSNIPEVYEEDLTKIYFLSEEEMVIKHERK